MRTTLYLTFLVLFFLPAAGGAPAPQATQGQARAGVERRGQGEREQRRVARQKPLTRGQLRSGAFRKLMERTGLDRAELAALYKKSGARNFGQFAAAIVVAEKLGLDRDQVLEGLRTRPLGRLLHDLGVPRERARAVRRMVREELKGKRSRHQ